MKYSRMPPDYSHVMIPYGCGRTGERDHDAPHMLSKSERSTS